MTNGKADGQGPFELISLVVGVAKTRLTKIEALT
jgi:hypothetical protein